MLLSWVVTPYQLLVSQVMQFRIGDLPEVTPLGMRAVATFPDWSGVVIEYHSKEDDMHFKHSYNYKI